MNTKYKVISLFSGIGGSSQGYKQAGFDVIAAVEFLDYQATNYRLNHPTTKLYECDIRNLDPLKVMDDLKLKVRELDVLDGSPPCSSFSGVNAGEIHKGWGKVKPYGNTKQRTDDLFLEYIRFLKVIQPKVFVAENVPGLTAGDSKGFFNEFIRAFRDCGYNVKAKILNAANYGVPQARRRIIFIGVRNDLNLEPKYPEPLPKKVVLKEAFEGVVNTEDDYIKAQINKSTKRYKIVKSLDKGGKSKTHFSVQKLNPNDVSYTLTATNTSGGVDNVHWDNRLLTIPEMKRICSFPDSYQLVGKSQRDRAEGLGRAVPPKMMEAIATTIKTEILDVLTVRLNRILSDVTEL